MNNKSGTASTSNSTCCGCFRRRTHESITLLEMYEMRCSDPGKCAQRARLGPPDNDCALSIKIATMLNEDKAEVREKIKESQQNANYTEFEFADDAISLNTTKKETHDCGGSPVAGVTNDTAKNPYITVNGKEELPCVHEIKYYLADDETDIQNRYVKKLSDVKSLRSDIVNNRDRDRGRRNLNGNYNQVNVRNVYGYCTLPKNKKKSSCPKYWLRHVDPPKRVTPDGTHIYYWCDMQKKICTLAVVSSYFRSLNSRKSNAKLDDGAYNPLWTMRGFTQTFHFWKENKRAQSVPLNAFLTYVTLPWWSIAKASMFLSSFI
ncbi:hypothetical protein NQ318_009895 [Aromia moschata]|uniref:Uncharacterized protein n=1 Tax=Aromia moschata TaxID=1265417 RepID=A0AAV8Y3T3_9CUCU|nr:hypothetical protein NQ318_009895 [Aromia moschata]